DASLVVGVLARAHQQLDASNVVAKCALDDVTHVQESHGHTRNHGFVEAALKVVLPPADSQIVQSGDVASIQRENGKARGRRIGDAAHRPTMELSHGALEEAGAPAPLVQSIEPLREAVEVAGVHEPKFDVAAAFETSPLQEQLASAIAAQRGHVGIELAVG